MAKFSLGQGLSRLEDEPLLRGAGRYADDVALAGAAHAVIVRSPHAHARIRGVSTGDARKAAGVIAMLTGKDAAADGLGHIECQIPVVNLDGSNRKDTPRPILALERVAHVGDPVAVVIAETLGQAKDAAEKVQVDYEALPAVTDAREGEVAFDIGLGESREKVEAALKKAAHVTRLELVNNRLVANPIEPRAALATDRDARFLALRVTTWANMGAYLSNFGPFIPKLAAPMLSGVYRIPAIYLNIKGTLTHTVPVDAYSGAGRPEAIYLLERVVDAAAREMGLAPDELRRRNFIPPSAMPYQTPVESKYDSGDFAAVMARAMEKADWAGFPARRKASKKLRGLGLALYIERCGGGPGDTIRLKVDGDKVTVYSGMQDNGQGHTTTFVQLLSAQLGIDAARIKVVQGDTDVVPTDGLTGGSRFLAIGGVAAQAAADEVIRKGKDAAATKLEAAASDIEYRDGEFRIAGTDRRVGLFELGALEATHTRTPEEYTYPNGCHICEVEVDADSGDVAIMRYTVVDDFGRAMNPKLLEGQVHGGTVQGIGQALREHAVYDRESGQLLTGSFMDYAMPRATDMPSLDCNFHHVPCASNPLGVKGAGEAGAVGAPAAVINAIVDAVGKNIDMPATAQAVWRALQPSTGRAGVSSSS